MKDRFYIGWSDHLPSGFLPAIRRFILVVFTIGVGVVAIWQFNQEEFSNATFDYGTQTTYEGTLVTYPAPMLRVQGEHGFESIPLVNYGKFGVADIVNRLAETHGDLHDVKVTLRGTAIQFDQRTWLELTDGFDAIESVQSSTTMQQEINHVETTLITGEIVDPKCFFGVMKPGFGKVHLSCAVRCISGGIPAILTTNPTPKGEREYFFLTGKEGASLLHELLPYIGMPVSIHGEVKKVDDWYALEVAEIQLAKFDPSRKTVYEVCN